MNCRSEVLEVSLEARQVDEAMAALLHTILLHRSTGKFHYKKEGTYCMGTVGTQDVDCDFIDFTFVRVSSDELERVIRKTVTEFKVRAQFSGSPPKVPVRYCKHKPTKKKPFTLISYTSERQRQHARSFHVLM